MNTICFHGYENILNEKQSQCRPKSWMQNFTLSQKYQQSIIHVTIKIKLYILWHLSNQRLILHISPHRSCLLFAWKEISLQRISFRRICNGNLTRLQDENSAFVENSNSAQQCLQTGSWVSWTWGSLYNFFSNKSMDYSKRMWRKWIHESIRQKKTNKKWNSIWKFLSTSKMSSGIFY